MSNYLMQSIVFHGMLRSNAPLKTVAPFPKQDAPSAPAVDAQASVDQAAPRRNYAVVAQTYAELQQPESSPGVSVWPHLLASAQTQRLNEISIYTEKGLTPEAMRYLYLNDAALEVWRELHPDVTVLTRLHRPPHGAVLAFGMPFSE